MTILRSAVKIVSACRSRSTSDNAMYSKVIHSSKNCVAYGRGKLIVVAENPSADFMQFFFDHHR